MAKFSSDNPIIIVDKGVINLIPILRDAVILVAVKHPEKGNKYTARITTTLGNTYNLGLWDTRDDAETFLHVLGDLLYEYAENIQKSENFPEMMMKTTSQSDDIDTKKFSRMLRFDD